MRLGGRWGWWWRDGEQSAFVGFSVANQRRDVVVGEKSIGEDLGRRKPSSTSLDIFTCQSFL